MNPELSPFRPGQLATQELFTGRKQEIERLRSMVDATAHGRLEVGFVTGERGIGKSSLASFVRHGVQMDGRVAGCHVFLGGVRTLEDMLRKVFNRILQESVDRTWHNQIRDFFKSRIKNVGMFGVSLELDLTASDLRRLSQDFVPAISSLLDKLKGEKNGLLLVFDDINGLARSPEVADWIKSTVDEIGASQEKVPLCMLFVGLEERRLELIESQPSLNRVFRLIDVKPWSTEETTAFFQRVFTTRSVQIGESELNSLAKFAGGLPILAQAIGDAVWRTARGPEIDLRAAILGLLEAAEIIGRTLLEPQVFSAIRSEKYRSILRTIYGVDPGWMSIRRSELLSVLPEDEAKVVDNFLNRMKEVGALKSDPEIRGGYRYPNRLYALYFWMEAWRMQNATRRQ